MSRLPEQLSTKTGEAHPPPDQAGIHRRTVEIAGAQKCGFDVTSFIETRRNESWLVFTLQMPELSPGAYDPGGSSAACGWCMYP